MNAGTTSEKQDGTCHKDTKSFNNRDFLRLILSLLYDTSFDSVCHCFMKLHSVQFVIAL
jgi:hypothetical protein